MRSFPADIAIALAWLLGSLYCMFIAARTRRPVWGRAPVLSVLWHTGLALIALFVLVTAAGFVGLVGGAVFRAVAGGLP